MRIYQTATGIQVADLAAHSTSVEVLDLSPDGSFVVSAAADGTVMSDIPGGEGWRVPGAPSAAANEAMSPDAKSVAIPIDGGAISIVDARTGSQLKSFYPAVGCDSSTGFCTYLPSPFGRAIAFSQDGKYLAIGGGYFGCTIGYTRGGLAALLGSNDIDAVAVGRNGRVAAVDTLEEGGSVRVYDLAHFGRLIGMLARHSPVIGVAFSPDGSKIATTETDGTLRLWDATTLRRLMVLATDADGKIEFSADGTRLVYGARGDVIRVLALRVDDLIQLAHARLARSEVRA